LTEATPRQPRRLYGRRRGRPLRQGRRRLAESLLPRIAVTLPDEDLLDPAALFCRSTLGEFRV